MIAVRRITRPRCSHAFTVLDPTKREASGRAKRIPCYFTSAEEAEAKLRELGKTILAVGVRGVELSPAARVDFYNRFCRHSAFGFASPLDYDPTSTDQNHHAQRVFVLPGKARIGPRWTEAPFGGPLGLVISPALIGRPDCMLPPHTTDLKIFDFTRKKRENGKS